MPGAQAHVREGPLCRFTLAGVLDGVGIGDGPVDRRPPGPGWCPRSRGARWWRRRSPPPCRRRPRRRWPGCASTATASSQSAPVGAWSTPLEVVEGGLVGRDQPGPRARPRCSCCTASSGLPSTATGWPNPRYSMTWPMPPPVPMAPMMVSTTSLAVTPGARSPSTVTAMVAGRCLGQRLGGQDVLDLARPDAEGERTERAVGGGVAVAADDRHARLGPALLGADDVDDALVRVAHRDSR